MMTIIPFYMHQFAWQGTFDVIFNAFWRNHPSLPYINNSLGIPKDNCLDLPFALSVIFIELCKSLPLGLRSVWDSKEIGCKGIRPVHFSLQFFKSEKP